MHSMVTRHYLRRLESSRFKQRKLLIGKTRSATVLGTVFAKRAIIHRDSVVFLTPDSDDSDDDDDTHID